MLAKNEPVVDLKFRSTRIAHRQDAPSFGCRAEAGRKGGTHIIDARRQPTAFLGLAVLAGFGIVRFLKSSADNAESPGSQSASAGKYSASGNNRSHDTGYRDEFTR